MRVSRLAVPWMATTFRPGFNFAVTVRPTRGADALQPVTLVSTALRPFTLTENVPVPSAAPTTVTIRSPPNGENTGSNNVPRPPILAPPEHSPHATRRAPPSGSPHSASYVWPCERAVVAYVPPAHSSSIHSLWK